MKDCNHYVFLLGGHDLEMMTIKELLLAHSYRVEDAGLTWANSKLSAYADVIMATDVATFIVGIELENDWDVDSARYIPINHHGDCVGKGSSLEQVAGLLELELSRKERLIAANDEGYIPAMKALGASREEIETIRLEDRKSQGVSEESEMTADENVKKAVPSRSGVVFVKTELTLFSPIVDRLYIKFPYYSYVVFNETDICTYGDVSKSFSETFHDHVGLYSGGTGFGYAGIANVKKGDMEGIIKQIKYIRPISKHIFLFPFEYKGEWKQLEVDSKWERVYSAKTNSEGSAIFNEKQYFYPFVHDVLYDNGGADSKIRHYERKIGDEYYIITVNKKEYRLKIESINLNLYDLGLGMLSFHLMNTEESQATPEDILKINQYGRRIMPPFYDEIAKNHPRMELADKIAIVRGEETILCDDFSYYKFDDTWKAGRFIGHFLSPLDFRPIIDDRMFTLCYYQDNHELERLAKARPQSNDFSRKNYNENSSEASSDFWYKFVFVDGGESATCYGTDMYKQLLKSQTYTRWEHPLRGTEYGVSSYSLVALTTHTAPSFLLDNFETIYSRLAEFVLCQRAGLVLFSIKVGALSDSSDVVTEDVAEKSLELTHEYIQFSNRFCLTDLTSQDQGRELYALLRKSLDTERYEVSLREQITRLNAIIQEFRQEQNAQSDKIQERNSYNLNKLAGAVIPVTIMTALLSLYQLSDRFYCYKPTVHIAVGIVFALGLILAFTVMHFIGKKNK